MGKHKHTCLSCDHLIEDADDEEQVPGLSRYRHKTVEGCQKAMATYRPSPSARQPSQRHPTLSEYDDQPDKRWF